MPRKRDFQPRRFCFCVAFLSVLVAPTAWAWPDMLVVKTGPTQAAPGELISYTLTYSNAGGVKGTSVVLKDFLPAGVTALTNTLGSGTLSGGAITWSLGTVNSRTGGSRTFQVRVASNAPSGLSITNRAQVTLQEAEEPGKSANNTSILVTRILSSNRPPVALNDAYAISEDTVLTVAAPGILANDSDPDGNALKANLVAGPAHGALTLNTNGSFTYRPATNYFGPDSFTYKANDGSLDSGIATVSLTITNLNEAPLANNDTYTLAEDTLLSIAAPGVLANDSDPDNDPLTAIIVTQPVHGILTFNPNGGFTYLPTTNYFGPDSFTYKANDGSLDSGIATVSLTISNANDPPLANNDTYGLAEDTLLSIAAPGVLANDNDPDNDPLTAIIVTQPAHGTLTLNPNGGFTYRPATNYFGPDSFTYKANDGSLDSGIATVSLTITNLNDAPLANDDTYGLAEDTLLSIAAPGVLANDSDPDNDPLTAIIVTQPAHGTLTLNPSGGFTYRPATNYFGPDSFTYRANDGSLDSDIATVALTISNLNDAPLANNDDYTIAEDTILTLVAPGVLSNDTDPDGDLLSAVVISNPVHGALSLNSNGSFTYAPTNDYNGVDSFTYQAWDGLTNSAVATVTIHVTPVNDPPDTNNWTGKNFTVYEDQTLRVSAAAFLAGLRDRDGDALSVSLVSDTLHGLLHLLRDGDLTFQPRTNYNGIDSFQFRVSDGVTNIAVLPATITVLPVNDEPSFIQGANQLIQQNAGSQTVPQWAHDISPGPTDEAGQNVTFRINHDNNALFAVPPAVSADGTLRYTPAPDRYGIATVTVMAQDDGGIANGGGDTSTPQTFSIAVNGPPTGAITSPTNGAVFFAPASFTLLADAHDPDGSVAKVEFFTGTNKLSEATSGEPYFTVLTNLPVGSYTYYAKATDNLDATGVSSPVSISVIQRPPLTILSALHYNPQTDFFEMRVRITNPTYSALNAVRVCVLNLTNIPAITVRNRSGLTNNVPYVQTRAAVPPGSYVDMVIEFYSPLRIAPNPILQPELVTPAAELTAPSGVVQHINQGRMLGNRTFMLEFATLSNRVYSVQYSSDLVTWKSAYPAVTGNGNWLQWIDNGLPKTESAPGLQSTRFYRVLLLP